MQHWYLRRMVSGQDEPEKAGVPEREMSRIYEMYPR